MRAVTAVLERDDAEFVLHQALAEARAGRGGLVLVAGEAGMGKTTLVRAFVDRAAGRPRVLQGACDPVAAGRPLGPLIDAAHDADPDLARRLAAGVDRAAAFSGALDLVDASPDRATVLVLEDLHWADDATLDLFTFLGRRLERRRALVVATYRSDEVDARHPLRARIGEMRDHIVARIALDPLTPEAVDALVAASQHPGLDAVALHRVTGGNPFYVTEVLSSIADGPDRADAGEFVVPVTVRDAALARAGRLPDSARRVLDAAAVLPTASPPWMIASLIGPDAPAVDVDSALDECIARGLLRRRSNGAIEFRHELARLAIESVVEPGRARRFHRRAVEALRGGGDVDHARLAHHAVLADDGAAVLEHAPVAAAGVSRFGGGRGAVELLEAALRYQHLVDHRRRGELLRELADALVVEARYADGLARHHQALDAFERAGDDLERAETLARCGDALWGLARQPELVDHLRRADELLGHDPAPSRAAAVVASIWCSAHMLAREPAPAEEMGQRAMALAEAIGDMRIYSITAIQSGISLCMAGDDRGLDRIRTGMQIAERHGDDRAVSHGYSQIGSGYGELRRYDIAIPALRDGIAFKADRELTSRLLYDQAWLARCELEVGEWERAARLAERLVGHARCVGNTRLVALCTLGWLRSRRGDPGVTEILDEALELGRRANHIQRLWPVAACRAEHAWLHGRLDRELPVVHSALALAAELDYRPAIEELTHWLAIADGRPHGAADTARTPFGLSAAGRWDLAFEGWTEIGCPYEAAFCRFMIGTHDAVRSSHAAFDALGATRMRDRAAERLRELGAAVPRGANRSTLGNPHGLTDRELDVLALLPLGVTNREIGARLHISPKTVAHHVSSVLAKLGVGTRAEAAVTAERLGVVADVTTSR